MEFKRTGGQWPNATEESRRQFSNVAWLITGRGTTPEALNEATKAPGVNPAAEVESQSSFLRRLAKITSKGGDDSADEAAAKCYIRHWDAIQKIQNDSDSGMCFPYFDDFTCWPAADRGETIVRPCSTKFKPPPTYLSNPALWNDNLTVSRQCSQLGSWVGGATTDYSPCVRWILNVSTDSFAKQPEHSETVMQCPNGTESLTLFAQAVAYPYAIGIIFCLACEILALFVFLFFRRQRDCRIKIHVHMLLSFILRFVIILCSVLQVAYSDAIPSRENQWLCRFVHVGLRSAILSNVFWMFVEGIYLHNRIAVCVFRNEANMKLFYFMGWGAPLAFVSGYALYVTMHKLHDFCPDPLMSLGLEHFIYGVPIILVYTINTGFLVNIFRVLVTRLRSTVTLEVSQMRRALQASFILFLLLGSTNMMFVWAPFKACSVGDRVWRVIACALELLQGILVPIFYCFTCKDIQQAVRNRWYRYRLNRINGRSLFSVRRPLRSSHPTGTTRTAAPERPLRLRFHRAEVGGTRGATAVERIPLSGVAGQVSSPPVLVGGTSCAVSKITEEAASRV